ncbi:DEAD/DEAH box helicase [Streptomyces sp. ODS28]|uniref:DEAD/DEAH box helicase n=1 Tax=Streptomyces sp. ODS28 TaxID=3136688 RepID=UPI0031EF0558
MSPDREDNRSRQRTTAPQSRRSRRPRNSAEGRAEGRPASDRSTTERPATERPATERTAADRSAKDPAKKRTAQAQGRPKRRTKAPASQRPVQAGPANGTGPADDAEPAAETEAPPAVSTFAELGLPKALLAALEREGKSAPFPIQAVTLPSSLAGRDVLGRGRTGSGKTLAFGLALLARTAGERAAARQPLGLVLVPTRELAQQVADALTPYARALSLRLATAVGGMAISRQSSRLREGAEVLIATPGRLKDLIERGDCRLDQVRTTVLDEADQMADMGFLPQVTALLRQVRPDGQRMLFSATLDRDVDRLVRNFLTDPVVHSVDPSAGAVTTMDHYVLRVADEDKHETALRIAARDGRVLLFVATKRGADRLTKRLLASGVHASALHGGKSQNQRNRTLEQFKTGPVTALVATNVAARGIHVDDLDLVVNVDPPNDHKDYLHRGGRTARAGGSGSVVTLVLGEQQREMKRLFSAAGVTPNTLRVRPDDAELARVTGAREPSGIPVTIAPPAQPAKETPKRRSGGGGSPAPAGRGRRSRRGGGSRTGSAAPRTSGSGSAPSTSRTSGSGSSAPSRAPRSRRGRRAA